LRRICLHPFAKMFGEYVRVSLITVQPIRLAQRHEVLMPIQFPDDLLVADKLGIEIVDLAPMQKRNAFSGYRLKVPLNRIAKTKVLVAKQIKLAFTESICLIDELLNRLRPS